MQRAGQVFGLLEEVAAHAQGLHLPGRVGIPDVLKAVDIVSVRQEGQGEALGIEAPAAQLVDEQQDKLLKAAQACPVLQNGPLQRQRGPTFVRDLRIRRDGSVAQGGQQQPHPLGISPGGTDQEQRQRVGMNGAGDQGPLQGISAEPDRGHQVAVLGDALRPHHLAEGVGAAEEGPKEALEAERAMQIAHQLGVELDGVVPPLSNAAQAADRRSEAVDADPHPQLPMDPFRNGGGGADAIQPLADGHLADLDGVAAVIDALATELKQHLLQGLGARQRFGVEVEGDVIEPGRSGGIASQGFLQLGEALDHELVEMGGNP